MCATSCFRDGAKLNYQAYKSIQDPFEKRGLETRIFFKIFFFQL